MTDKKKKDYFSNLFTTTTTTKKKDQPFDETYFDIQVTGGPMHSQKIEIRGVAKVGVEEVKLKCNWFLISPQHDITNLTTVTEQHYQPSVDDIGFKLMIQAEPIIEGRLYDGMPQSVEVGPLEMDQDLQNDTNELLEAEQLTVILKLLRVTLQRDEEYKDVVECRLLMKVNLKDISLEFKLEDTILKHTTQALDAEYPQCRCVRNSNNQFYLMLNEQTEFIIEAEDNLQRDIILVVVKSFYGKALCEAGELSLSGSLAGSHRNSLLAQDGQLKAVTDHLEQFITQHKQSLEIDSDPELQQDQAQDQVIIPQDQIIITQDQVIESFPLSITNLELDATLTPLKQTATTTTEPNLNEQVSLKFQNTLNHWKEKVQSSSKQQNIIQKSTTQQQEQPQQFSQSQTEIQVPDTQSENKLSPIESKIVVVKDAEETIQLKLDDPRTEIIKDDPTEIEPNPIVKGEKKKKEKMNVDYFMLVNENAKLKQEKESLNQQLIKEKAQNTLLQKKYTDLQDNLTTCTKNFYAMQDKSHKQDLEIEQFLDQKIFYQSDINLYRSETKDIKDELIQVQEELSTFQKRMRRQTINQDLQSLKEKYGALERSLEEKQSEVDSAQKETNECQTRLYELEGSIEQIQNELQHERKKNESLIQEKGLTQTISMQESNIDLGDGGDKHQENNRLKQYISNLEATLRSLKFAYEQDVRFVGYNKLKNKVQKQSNTDWKFLQNLANSLSEVITEKETALENQKYINRELLNRLTVNKADTTV